MILNNSIVVAAFYCCGKSYLHKHPELCKYSVIEIEDTIKNKRNIAEYINTLNKSIGKYDLIFVTVQDFVLNYLQKNHIQYCLVYPDSTQECLEEWGRRNLERSDLFKWAGRKITFKHFINKKLKRDTSATHHFVLNPDQYLSDILDDIVAVYKSEIN